MARLSLEVNSSVLIGSFLVRTLLYELSLRQLLQASMYFCFQVPQNKLNIIILILNNLERLS